MDHHHSGCSDLPSCLSPSGAPSGVPIAQSMAWSRGPGENLCSGGRSSISTFSSGHVWMWELDYRVEHWRIDAFELWCWRRLLRVPWTARRSNQSILKEISPECSLEGLMLKLKLQYFGHLMRRTDSLEKTLILGKTEGGRKGDDRGWDGWMVLPTRWIWVWVSSGSWWWTGKPGVLQSMGSQRVGHDWATELTERFSIIHRS